MGADFSSHWLFIGSADASQCRARLVEALPRLMRESGLEGVASEQDATRSLVVGPAGRWIFIGDSAGSTEWADPEGFDDLSRRLSALGVVVDVKVSDSAAVDFYQYLQGRLVDKFGNAAFPFYRFATEEDAAP